MSRPIVEPSTPKEIGHTKFRTSQLERRPAPTLSTVAEYAWMSCNTQPNVPDTPNNPTNIPWDQFLTTNQTVFDVVGGTGTTDLTCYAPGAYWFEVKAKMFDVGAHIAFTPAGTIFSWIDGADGSWLAANNFIVNTDPPGTSEWAVRDVATAWINTTGIHAGSKTVFVQAWNKDSVDHLVNIAYLKAVWVPGSNDLDTIF